AQEERQDTTQDEPGNERRPAARRHDEQIREQAASRQPERRDFRAVHQQGVGEDLRGEGDTQTEGGGPPPRRPPRLVANHASSLRRTDCSCGHRTSLLQGETRQPGPMSPPGALPDPTSPPFSLLKKTAASSVFLRKPEHWRARTGIST